MDDPVGRRDIAVFIDMENLFGGYGADVSGVPLSRILNEIHAEVKSLEVGSLAATTRAYANWGFKGMTTYHREVLENGVEPVHIFSNDGRASANHDGRRKNAADIQLVVDALTVAVEAPWVKVFVIVSGDGDFVPLVRRLQYLGKVVIGVGLSDGRAGGVSKLLRTVVDHFLEVRVGEDLLSPVPPVARAKADATATKPAAAALSSVPSDRIPSLKEYVATVVQLTKSHPNALKSGAVDGAVMGGLLRRRWPRVTYSDFDYRTLGSFIEDACKLPMFRPNVANASPTATPQPTTVTPPSLRAELEAVPPRISYPEIGPLTKVLTELTLQFEPLPFDDLSDRVGGELSDVPAEQIRLALRLLLSVGAFSEVGMDGLNLSGDVASVEDGISLVLDDAQRRARTIDRSVTKAEVEAALFPE
ncbi:NYN domain-containing protein [Marisediminicola antarctica]|uniref:NYN domain-containing protein n=1 Tax=Marisediminicola antarctica TaxID=674079 RepID=A0A7L5AKW2_9MICO|nr:NYN domain-containing protein [Marisediminicola antarctica]QHO68949.1 hypothetical protein BHD05_04130 [Marisediminicola antarctica]